MFWVWRQAIGKGIDFHDFAIRNGVELYDFRVRNGVSLKDFEQDTRFSLQFLLLAYDCLCFLKSLV